MSRLLIPLMTGLLWVGTTNASGRELGSHDPVRATLLDLARNTPVPGLPTDTRITLSHAWVDGTQAKVCAAARRADGELLVQDGQLQMKRIHLRKRGASWDIERAEHIVMVSGMSIDSACQQRAPDTVMAEAAKLLETAPPTAGIKAASTINTNAKAGCLAKPFQTANASQPTSPGVVALPGRSLLHTLPDQHCLMGKHIVEGDKVLVLNHVPGWTQVQYTHPITHVVTVGWLLSERVTDMPVSAQNQRHAAMSH